MAPKAPARRIVGDSAAEKRAVEDRMRAKKHRGDQVGTWEQEYELLKKEERAFNEARKKKKLGNNIYNSTNPN